MILKKRREILIIFALIVFFFAGCENIDTITLQDTLPEQQSSINIYPQTESVCVYLDTTPSMKGFLDKKNETYPNYYIICLDEINRMISSKDNVIFYRVDTPLWEIMDEENALQEGKYENYYNDSQDISNNHNYNNLKNTDTMDGYEQPCLTAALENGKNKEFFLLITDFYENKAGQNTSQLIRKLKELAGQEDNKVFGIVGIRSAFSGKIYDCGPNGETIEYGIDEDRRRQFYVLVRGYPKEVRDFCDKLKERIGAEQGYCESCVFYEEEFPRWRFWESVNCEKFDKNILWINSGDKVVINTNKEIPLFSYHASDMMENRNVWFSYEIPAEYLEAYNMLAERQGKLLEKETEINLGSGTYEINAICESMEVALWSNEENKFQVVEDSKNYFEMKSIYFDPGSGKLYVEMHINESNITEGVLRFKWKYMMDSQADLPYSWYQDWNFKNGTDDFGKTESLVDYVDAILEGMPKVNRCFLEGVIYLRRED